MITFYRQLLKRSWQLTWQYKWIWVLSFFAAFIGQGGVYEFLFRSFHNMSYGQSVFFSLQEYANSGMLGMISFGRIQNLWVNDFSSLATGIFSLLVVMCVFALFITLAIICQGALVKAIYTLEQEKKIGLKESFKAGLDKFWTVFGLNIITKVILLAILLFIAYVASLLLTGHSILDTIIFTIFFVLFIILGIIIYFLTVFGVSFIVIKGKNVRDALTSAWQLFRSNVMMSLEMGLLLFIANIAFSFVALAGLFIVLSPFVLLMLFAFLVNNIILADLLSIIIVGVIICILVLLGSWLNAFQMAGWVVLFNELDANRGTSKVQRIFEHLWKLNAKRLAKK